MKKKNKLSIYILVIVISAFIGFIYEVIFYKIDSGVFLNRGITYGPWIPIYAVGSALILFFANKFKSKPVKTFFISLILSFVVELVGGYVLHQLFDLRLWDYNKEIWNFGNIGGYVCLRSILLFAFAGLFLVHYILPLVIKVSKSVNDKVFDNISYILGITFLFDVIISMLKVFF